MPAIPETLYEQTLVIRSQLGDEAAFEELLGLHGPRLLLFTQRILQSSPESVADVTQETWIAIYRALPRLLDPSRFRSWAFRIARDRIYREYRRRKLPGQPADDAHLADVPESAELDSTIGFNGQCVPGSCPFSEEAGERTAHLSRRAVARACPRK